MGKVPVKPPLTRSELERASTEAPPPPVSTGPLPVQECKGCGNPYRGTQCAYCGRANDG